MVLVIGRAVTKICFNQYEPLGVLLLHVGLKQGIRLTIFYRFERVPF